MSLLFVVNEHFINELKIVIDRITGKRNISNKKNVMFLRLKQVIYYNKTKVKFKFKTTNTKKMIIMSFMEHSRICDFDRCP